MWTSVIWSMVTRYMVNSLLFYIYTTVKYICRFWHKCTFFAHLCIFTHCACVHRIEHWYRGLKKCVEIKVLVSWYSSIIWFIYDMITNVLRDRSPFHNISWLRPSSSFITFVVSKHRRCREKLCAENGVWCSLKWEVRTVIFWGEDSRNGIRSSRIAPNSGISHSSILIQPLSHTNGIFCSLIWLFSLISRLERLHFPSTIKM